MFVMNLANDWKSPSVPILFFYPNTMNDGKAIKDVTAAELNYNEEVFSPSFPAKKKHERNGGRFFH